MSICSNQVAQRSGCLAVTLEMPFKDTDGYPEPKEVCVAAAAGSCLRCAYVRVFCASVRAHRNDRSCSLWLAAACLLPALLQGWSPQRAKKLGGAMLTAVLEVLPQLRAQPAAKA